MRRVHEDFKSQCKDYLNDHVIHRREVFTNQKAQFNKDIENMKLEFDDYLTKMHDMKNDLACEIYELQEENRNLKTTSQIDRPDFTKSSENKVLFNMHETPRTHNVIP